jgi:hypothetical protein
MATFDLWSNEWTSITQAPHLLTLGAIVMTGVVAGVMRPVIRGAYSAYITILQSQLKRARKKRYPGEPAETVCEYHGEAGHSHACEMAVMRLLQFRTPIRKARIVSYFDPAGRNRDPRHCVGEHGFLLATYEGTKQLIAIKSGFSSGYGGGGPHAFAFVLALLDAHK